MASSPAPERDTSLLGVGKQCSDPGCLLVDFLPFECQHCKHSFCQEHFKVDGHRCPEYDESKHNRVAPNCPLCNTPVAVRQGQDPNVRMDFHLERECSVVTGKVRAKTTPLCASATCKKVLFSPIRCTSCRQQFCPAHRFPGDHICSAAPAKASNGTSRNGPSMAAISAGAQNLNAKAVTAGNAALGAVKSSLAAASVPTPRISMPSGPSAIPFRGMDSPSDPSLHFSPAAPHNIETTTSTTMTSTNPVDNTIKPSPIINILLLSNFVPRPIFGTA